MALDKNQALAASSFGRSLAIIAGAGSGKTKTMESRVVEAFIAREHDEAAGATVKRAHPKIIEGIDELLAITFTEAAASELKARVKTALREQGDPKVAEQALLVDDSWISTIHGMCSRLLKENAATLGVDPSFSIMSESARTQLLSDVIQEAMGDPDLDGLALLEEFGMGGGFTGGLPGYVTAIIGAALKSPAQFDSFVLPPACDVRATLGYLREALLNDPASDIARLKDEEPDVKYGKAGLDVEGDGLAIARIDELLQKESVSADEALLACTVFKLKGSLSESKPVPALEGWSAPWAQGRVYNRRSAIESCVLSLQIAAATSMLEKLIAFARACYERFCAEKERQGVMDNDDLLIKAYRALANEQIRALYADKFKLVIVDEFQDTNQLQLEIIRNFTGPNDERLCVVGDRMQSIYRFQGADVSVCNGHLERSAQETLNLDSNYRSHAQIIDFVDRAFCDMDCEYLQLVAQFDESRQQDYVPYSEELEGPRVQVMEAQCSGKSDTEARAMAARFIALRFKAMHDARLDASGEKSARSYGDMVVLLNKMTHAEVYADALRAEGIPCQVVKGSILRSSNEAAALLAYLAYLGNPDNTQALLTVLASGLFSLGDADLAELFSVEQRSLAPAFKRYAQETGRADGDAAALLAGLSERAQLAVSVLGDALSRVGAEPVSRLCERLLVQTGAVLRMESPDNITEGQAQAGNYLKLVRIVKQLESEGVSGPNALAAQLSAHLENNSEAPGSLSVSTSEAVRIMTIHGSKGLAFPIVALGEATLGARSDRLQAESAGGKTYLCLEGGSALKDYAKSAAAEVKTSALVKSLGLDKEAFDLARFEQSVGEAQAQGDPAGYAAALAALHRTQEADELERKIYVAMTRPQAALIVTTTNTVSADEIKELQGTTKANLAINTRGLKGKLTGSLKELQRKADELRACGWDYLTVTPMWTHTWMQTGVVPPVLLGRPDAPENADGFDLSTIAQADAAEESAEKRGFAVYASSPLKDRRDQRYASNWTQGILSASSIKSEAHEVVSEAADGQALLFDEADNANEVMFARDPLARGLAFHALGEWSARHSMQRPSFDRVRSICRFHGLGPVDTSDVSAMLGKWFASDAQAAAAAAAHAVPEAPFFITLSPQGVAREIRLNGFIDLLAYDRFGEGDALVVDYKTGTSLTTPKDRHDAYEVQALVYAYAVLSQGFERVSLSFVFVEQDEDGALPVEVFPKKGEFYSSKEDVREKLLSLLPKARKVDA